MTRPAPSVIASSELTNTLQKVISPIGLPETGTATTAEIYYFESQPLPAAKTSHFTELNEFVKAWEQDDDRRTALEEARHWVADTLYSDDGDTVRTLRLRKGWSQARLAEELSTSQSHIARMEKGRDNLTINTCRRLAKALDIDLNTLDKALQRQERLLKSDQADS